MKREISFLVVFTSEVTSEQKDDDNIIFGMVLELQDRLKLPLGHEPKPITLVAYRRCEDDTKNIF